MLAPSIVINAIPCQLHSFPRYPYPLPTKSITVYQKKKAKTNKYRKYQTFETLAAAAAATTVAHHQRFSQPLQLSDSP